MFFSRRVKVPAKMSQHCIDCKNVEIRYSVELFSFEENARLSRKFVGTDIFQCHCSHMQNFAVSHTNNAQQQFVGKDIFRYHCSKMQHFTVNYTNDVSNKEIVRVCSVDKSRIDASYSCFYILVFVYVFIFVYVYV